VTFEFGKEPLFTKILVPIDGSLNSSRAARVAISLASKFNDRCELVVVGIVPVPPLSVPMRLGHAPPPTSYEEYFAWKEKETLQLVRQIVLKAKDRGLKASGEIEPSVSVVNGIIETAQNKEIDLIVMGTRGLSGFKRLLLGSVSSGVLTHAHCSVLIVR
jgi:nucleotide-binding universal stress UspA family protein